MIQVDDLKGKVCVVTGATGVLCSVMVRALCKQGAKVAMIARTQEKLDTLARQMRDAGHDCIGVSASVTDREALEAARETIVDTFGPADILVNGAGGNSPKATTPLENLDPDSLDDLEKSFFGIDLEGFDFVFDLNLKGTVLPTTIFAEAMVKRGTGVIINVSSMSALLPLTKVVAYSAAKASVDSFTRWLATHLAPTGVRVNALSPGFFVSEQNRFLLYEQDGKTLSARGGKIVANTPMGRFGEAEELEGALLFLASEMSRFVTGIVLPVDGGFSAYSGV